MKRSLSQSQASELMRAMSLLPPAARAQFLHEVDSRLVGIRHHLTDGDVAAAIISALSDTNIVTSHMMCDAAEGTRTMRTHDQDPELYDERGLLRDGKSLRVSLMMRDSMSEMQRTIAEDKARRVQFGDGSDDFARHKPGQRFSTDRAANDASVAELQDAWRTPVKNVSDRDVSARPAHRPAIAVSDADFAHCQAVRDAAYEQSVKELEDAWKGPAR